MKIEREGDTIFIEANVREVVILKNCLLNLDNLCGEGEFHTYVGATKVEAEMLRKTLLSVLRKGGE